MVVTCNSIFVQTHIIQNLIFTKYISCGNADNKGEM